MVRRYLRQLYEGPRATQLRRFFTVGLLTAGIQMALLWTFVDVGGLDYLVGAAVAIEITIVLSYVLNNAWTFRAVQHTSLRPYLRGLVRTNVVRGSAIPIQLAVLAALVELQSVPYLAANVGAIAVSGLYRYALDTRWTWKGGA
ncbi:polysaccharide biosynthesis protein GtrA [Halarchaeum grantii]|uniref:Polysaccharide biosynthesis protein GtrA n=1 Tax=Halarchaeum grantii TaxID=1193105 RepID=A0A830EZ99_9EURY|nr:GtrA family protein [Halarchaeum grantii]GGL44883.1 polysaccharide biosynthesis protein GtrA [Halarchaeum grantii]